MGLITKAINKEKGKDKITIEDTYGMSPEEEAPSILELFAQWSAERLKNEKGKARLAEVE